MRIFGEYVNARTYAGHGRKIGDRIAKCCYLLI
jgi:hypothetical protein